MVGIDRHSLGSPHEQWWGFAVTFCGAGMSNGGDLPSRFAAPARAMVGIDRHILRSPQEQWWGFAVTFCGVRMSNGGD